MYTNTLKYRVITCTVHLNIKLLCFLSTQFSDVFRMILRKRGGFPET